MVLEYPGHRSQLFAHCGFSYMRYSCSSVLQDQMQLFVKTLTANTGRRDTSYFLWVRACPISSGSYVIANPILHILPESPGNSSSSRLCQSQQLLVKAHTTSFPLDFYRGEDCHHARTESKERPLISRNTFVTRFATQYSDIRKGWLVCVSCTDRLVSSNGNGSFLFLLFHCI